MAQRKLYKVTLLLGSNLPFGKLSPVQIIEEADREIIDALLPDYLEVESLEDAVSVTDIITTDPCGEFEAERGEDGKIIETPKFFNQALCCITEKNPEEILSEMQRIEKLFGRKRPVQKKKPDFAGKQDKPRVYQSRTLDIDILTIRENAKADKIADKGADKKAFWVEIKRDTPTLKLPHPQIETRPFVKPLMVKLNRPDTEKK